MNTINAFNFRNIKNPLQKLTKIQAGISRTHFKAAPKNEGSESLNALANYNAPVIKKRRRKINWDKISGMRITNLAFVDKKGVRGETLSSKRNRHYLFDLKGCGIENVIDLREKYVNTRYADFCKNAGLQYFNIPIDSSTVSDEEIIENLPLLINLINGGNFYISCAQGLHRTDIALALNYVFNPKSKIPPLMLGHFRGNGLKSEDIIRRINSIAKKASEQDIKKMGWECSDKFQEEFHARKKELVQYNKLIGQIIADET